MNFGHLKQKSKILRKCPTEVTNNVQSLSYLNIQYFFEFVLVTKSKTTSLTGISIAWSFILQNYKFHYVKIQLFELKFLFIQAFKFNFRRLRATCCANARLDNEKIMGIYKFTDVSLQYFNTATEKMSKFKAGCFLVRACYIKHNIPG